MIRTSRHRMNAFSSTVVLALIAGVCASTPLRAEDAQTDDTALPEFVVPPDFDGSQLATYPSPADKPLKPGKKASVQTGNDMSWKRDDKPDGSSAVTVKQPVVPFWDTRIGADMSVVTQTPTTSSEVLQQKLDHGNQFAQSSGSAWAAMTAPE